MSDIFCGYTGDREAMLMAYLYDEIAPADRDAFGAHLATCARCRVELNGLGGVRAQLARWVPPNPSFALASHQSSAVSPTTSSERRVPSTEQGILNTGTARGARWRDIPVWAQVAAAMLFLGVSAGVANLDVHYDAQNGVNVRTGWSKRSSTNMNAAAASNAAPWRAELTTLERQLRSEFHASQASAPSATAAALARSNPSSDADVVRRVKALVDESERRQQRELALRVAELLRDVNMQRQADLRKIDQNLGLIQDRTGVEVLKNRQMIDYYIQRASQRP